MPVISVTRFRLRSRNPIGYALFAWHTLRSGRQAERTLGFLGGRLAADRARAFWTVTAWSDAAAMHGFRGSGDHRRAMRGMRVLDRYCDEAATVTWSSPSDQLPDEATMQARMQESGRFLRLSRPSRDHSERRIASPDLLGGRALRPHASHRAGAVRGERLHP
jgi:heme-degrading monooxygenase HmoA